MSKLNVVAVSGNVSSPSRTLVLAREIAAAIGNYERIKSDIIEIAEIGPLIGSAFFRKELPREAEAVIKLIERADILIAATPVYRASYTGLFKHLFDFVDQDALVDVPIILAATAGSSRHALMLEHELRPLFSFFRAYTVPTGIYATEADFENYQINNKSLAERIDTAAFQAVNLVRKQYIFSEELRAIA
jgi:FMN reductase